MRLAHVVQIVTPKRYLLNGLWFGPKKARNVIVWVHGLSSSVFGKASVIDSLVDDQTAILVFNNRGHDKVSSITNSKGLRMLAGAAHEVFTDCVDDIDGAIRFAQKQGIRNVYIAGTSTGAQKSVYWAHKKGRGVKGIILLAPISDYSAECKSIGKKRLKRIEKIAHAYVKAGKKHELLPTRSLGWSLIIDAQRFLSLYTGDSDEETFSYWNAQKKPRALPNVKIPILVLLAQKDEYADRPASKIGEWFMKWLYTGHVVVIPKVKHSFKGGEKEVSQVIRDFMKES